MRYGRDFATFVLVQITSAIQATCSTDHPGKSRRNMRKLSEVCEELDKVLIEVMATLDELSSLRAKYSDAVSEVRIGVAKTEVPNEMLYCIQGYFYMAQARHVMGGPSSVSSLQYDGRMSALVHVNPVPEVEAYDELTKLVSSKEGLSIEFQVNRSDSSKPVKKPDSKTKSAEGELRRRNVDKDSVEDVPLKGTKETTTIECKDEVNDPIKWFGVLVPPYLRRSQDHFKQGKLFFLSKANLIHFCYYDDSIVLW